MRHWCRCACLSTDASRLSIRAHAARTAGADHGRMVYLAAMRLASSAATRSLPTFRAAGRAGRLAGRRSAEAAEAAAHRALATVPAYSDFVGQVPPRAPAAQWLRALPVADKKSYIDAYPLAARCRHGTLPVTAAELDESSGSSGRRIPGSGPRPSSSRCAGNSPSWSATSSRANRTPGRPVVTINGFSMGAWATGTNVSHALGLLG